MAAEEVFSNPVAPAGETFHDERPQKLTNADFRKLIMTPRVPSVGLKDSSTNTTVLNQNSTETATKTKDVAVDAKSSERKKKKSYYARIKKEEEEKMAELAEKYRDRARERRDGKNPDYHAEDPSQPGVGAYRAVAPDLKSGLDAVQRRKQMIQESKFLGGDMEHTHLVKGLDYALLQKVRSEILIKVQEIEPEGQVPPAEIPREKEVLEGEEEMLSFKTSLGKRTYMFIFDSKQSEFNENFVPGRMAYCYYLEEDAETDIPITVIRSKTDNMALENRQATFTTNDIVIDKLSQIFSYLRTGRTNKSKKKKDKTKEPEKAVADENIYPELEEYVPASSKPDKERPRDKDRHRDRRDRGDRDRERDRRDRHRNRHDNGKERRSYFTRPAHEELRTVEEHQWPAEDLAKTQGTLDSQALTGHTKSSKASNKRLMETDYYTECYPGMAEMQDAIEDSDDEADYTKMDLGNKKGPVGRWDFDTQEEYSEYMNHREAMPKAAFQYGVKMADGRKTRRIGGNKEKDRNAELNREWQQILKRRGEGDSGRTKRPKFAY